MPQRYPVSPNRTQWIHFFLALIVDLRFIFCRFWCILQETGLINPKSSQVYFLHYHLHHTENGEKSSINTLIRVFFCLFLGTLLAFVQGTLVTLAQKADFNFYAHLALDVGRPARFLPLPKRLITSSAKFWSSAKYRALFFHVLPVCIGMVVKKGPAGNTATV